MRKKVVSPRVLLCLALAIWSCGRPEEAPEAKGETQSLAQPSISVGGIEVDTTSPRPSLRPRT